jgi:hypothetical protein
LGTEAYSAPVGHREAVIPLVIPTVLIQNSVSHFVGLKKEKVAGEPCSHSISVCLPLSPSLSLSHTYSHPKHTSLHGRHPIKAFFGWCRLTGICSLQLQLFPSMTDSLQPFLLHMRNTAPAGFVAISLGSVPDAKGLHTAVAAV